MAGGRFAHELARDKEVDYDGGRYSSSSSDSITRSLVWRKSSRCPGRTLGTSITPLAVTVLTLYCPALYATRRSTIVEAVGTAGRGLMSTFPRDYRKTGRGRGAAIAIIMREILLHLTVVCMSVPAHPSETVALRAGGFADSRPRARYSLPPFSLLINAQTSDIALPCRECRFETKSSEIILFCLCTDSAKESL